MARIVDLLAAGRTISFEFFPPKTDDEQAALVRTLVELQSLNPSFVSVTYRGGRSSRVRTHELVAGMLRTTGFTPMAHLICVDHTRLELAEILVDFRKAGVENLLALGGDQPTGPDVGPGELTHAIELVELAQAIGGFSIGVAAHPIGHPRSPDIATDRRYLAEKLRLADFATTQFFFEVDDYLRLVDELGALGVTKPVIAGIMPVTAASSIPRMATMGAGVPEWMVARLEKYSDPADVYAEGVACATELCEALISHDVPGLHFYTLNKSRATQEITRNLGLS
jgi:methylenetetrahydrofolate reductase (NADPH)